MITFRLLFVPVALLLAGSESHGTTAIDQDEMQQLGKVEVDDYEGLVMFQDPADDGKSYRVTLAISKPWDKPGIKTSRFGIWLLARGGKALKVVQAPVGDVLIEAGSIGATANAIYFFDRSVPRDELTALVVTVDGQPTVYRIQVPKANRGKRDDG